MVKVNFHPCVPVPVSNRIADRLVVMLIMALCVTLADKASAAGKREIPSIEACRGLFESGNVDIRILALDQAMAHKMDAPEDLRQLLIKSLQDGNAGVRSVGATFIGRIKAKEAVKPLIDCLATADMDVAQYNGGFGLYTGWRADYWRADVITALGKLGPEAAAALPAVRSQLAHWVARGASEQRNRVIEASATFIGIMKDVDSGPSLIALFKDDSIRRHPKAAIARALGRIGGDEAIKLLADYAQRGVEGRSRAAAIDALSNFQSERVHDVLLSILRQSDSEEWILALAAQVAVRTETPGALPELLKLAEKHRNERDLCEGIAKAIKEYSGPHEDTVPILNALALHSSSDVPCAAIDSAKTLGQPGLEFIIRCLGHSDANVRGGAADAIGDIGSGETIPVLNEVLGTETNRYVRDDLLKAIAMIEKRCAQAQAEGGLGSGE
ncbi:MAG: hypothetical protein GMKNLPBB_02914 [Myxococcota bacterium]|nr:hypothetical protein [Myxococcota bacterium]